jgi:hypothetical protein
MLTITQLRVALGVLGRNWAALMKYSDTALRGYLGLARAKGSYPPQVGLTIESPSDRKSIFLDLAWPDQKEAISLSISSQKKILGWTVYSLSEAINKLS